MSGSMGRPVRPLPAGQISTGDRIQLGIGLARDIGVAVPGAGVALGMGIAQLADVTPPAWLTAAGKAAGLAGTVFSAELAFQEAMGTRSSWARLRRRARLGLGLRTSGLKMAMAGAMTAIRAGDVVLPIASAFSLLGGFPISSVTSIVSGSIRVVRTATELAQASRLGGLVGVVKARRGGQGAGARLEVLDRLSTAVRSCTKQVLARVGPRLQGLSRAESADLLGQARSEVQAVLSDRVGHLGACKLLEMASSWARLAKGSWSEAPSSDSLDPLEQLQEEFNGLESLRLLLTSPARDLDELRGSAAELADALVHSLREDVRLMKTRAVCRLLFAIAGLLLSLAALASFAFPPAAPIMLIIQASFGLANTLSNLGLTYLDIQLKRRADLSPLRQRLQDLTGVAQAAEQRRIQAAREAEAAAERSSTAQNSRRARRAKRPPPSGT
jgi:hypothetical protein